MAKSDRNKSAISGRRRKTVLATVALLLVAAWAVAPITSRVDQNRKLAALHQEEERMLAENRRLRREIVKLKGDKAYWETLARRNLGLVKSDEEAYVVVEKEPAPSERPDTDSQAEGAWEGLTDRIKELSLTF